MSRSVIIKQFLGSNHSWSTVGQGIARGLLAISHQVDLFSTNGTAHFPPDLLPHLIGHWDEGKKLTHGRDPHDNYDVAISFTAMPNFQENLRHGKRKLGIWMSEAAGVNALPNGFAKHHRECDWLIPPSEFARQVFLDSGIPEAKMKTIPLGLGPEWFAEGPVYPLKTDKRFRLLSVFGQPHLRKGIPELFEAYGRAFTDRDDVCFVVKAVDKEPRQPFEVSLSRILHDFERRHPRHAEILVLRDFIPDMSDVYRACSAAFSMTRAECFFLPALEALATGIINIVPSYGGQRDFCNSGNSLMIPGQVGFAPPQSLYWQQKPGTLWFNPDVDEAATLLRQAYTDTEALTERFNIRAHIGQTHSWRHIAQRIMELA